jgi:hypothetical protein
MVKLDEIQKDMSLYEVTMLIQHTRGVEEGEAKGKPKVRKTSP